MDDKEIERKMAALGRELSKKRAEEEAQSHESQREYGERKTKFEQIKADVIEPAVGFFKTLAAKNGLVMTVEKCGSGDEGITLRVGHGCHLTIMPLGGYSGIMCLSTVPNTPSEGHRPDTKEVWNLEDVTREDVNTAIMTFVEDVVARNRV